MFGFGAFGGLWGALRGGTPDPHKQHHRQRSGKRVRPVTEKPWHLATTRERLKASTRQRSLVTDNERRRAFRQAGRSARFSNKPLPEWRRSLLEQGRREKVARRAARKAANRA